MTGQKITLPANARSRNRAWTRTICRAPSHRIVDNRPIQLHRCDRNPMNKAASKIKEEFLAMIPPTVFFFVALHIVGLVRALMTKGTGFGPISTVSIAIAALILGKAVLIADMLPIINRYPAKPLIYNVVWKTLIYLLVSALIHYLERLYDFWKEAGSFVARNAKFLAENVWPPFFAIQNIFFVLFLIYFNTHEM